MNLYPSRNADQMLGKRLGQCRKRLTNIEPILDQRHILFITGTDDVFISPNIFISLFLAILTPTSMSRDHGE